MFLTTVNEIICYHDNLADAASRILLNAARLWDDDLIPNMDYFNIRDALLGLGGLERDVEALPFDYLTNNGITYRIEVI